MRQENLSTKRHFDLRIDWLLYIFPLRLQWIRQFAVHFQSFLTHKNYGDHYGSNVVVDWLFRPIRKLAYVQQNRCENLSAGVKNLKFQIKHRRRFSSWERIRVMSASGQVGPSQLGRVMSARPYRYACLWVYIHSGWFLNEKMYCHKAVVTGLEPCKPIYVLKQKYEKKCISHPCKPKFYYILKWDVRGVNYTGMFHYAFSEQTSTRNTLMSYTGIFYGCKWHYQIRIWGGSNGYLNPRFREK